MTYHRVYTVHCELFTPLFGTRMVSYHAVSNRFEAENIVLSPFYNVRQGRIVSTPALSSR